MLFESPESYFVCAERRKVKKFKGKAMSPFNIFSKVKTVNNGLKGRIRSLSRSSSGGSTSSRNSMQIYNHGELKILVLGNPGVGKTSICRKYVGFDNEVFKDQQMLDSECSEVYDTGIFINFNNTTRQYDLEIFDFEGVTRNNPLKYKKNIEQSDGFLLVYSKDNVESFMRIFEVIHDVHNVKGPGCPLLVVGNKSDKSTLSVSDATLIKEAHVSVSAELNEGIQEAFHLLISQCISYREKQEQV